MLIQIKYVLLTTCMYSNTYLMCTFTHNEFMSVILTEKINIYKL